MNISGIRRLVVALGLIALVATLTFGGVVQATTPTPVGHDTHHGAATPASTGACASPAIGTPTTSDMMGGGDMMTGSPMAGQSMQMEFDLMFIDMMIVHHQGAIAMAEVALERGEHQEIRDLAQSIISSQQAEIDQMQAWRDTWYPGAAETSMEQMAGMMGDMMPSMMGTPAADMGDMSDMMGMMDPHADHQALCSTTENFDTAFITMMIPHHESAVAMAQVALMMATHPEIKQLAQEIIDAQQTEIA